MHRLFLAVIATAFATAVFAAEPEIPAKPEGADDTQYEVQRITAKPGKLEQIHPWLRDHQDDVLAKHGATNIAYLVRSAITPTASSFVSTGTQAWQTGRNADRPAELILFGSLWTQRPRPQKA